MKAEIQRRHSYTLDVLAYFQARPGQWIDAHVLMKVGGTFASRTRISDARRIVRKAGGDIENRVVRDQDGRIIGSEYRYRPQARLGRDAGSIVSQPALW